MNDDNPHLTQHILPLISPANTYQIIKNPNYPLTRPPHLSAFRPSSHLTNTSIPPTHLTTTIFKSLSNDESGATLILRFRYSSTFTTTHLQIQIQMWQLQFNKHPFLPIRQIFNFKTMVSYHHWKTFES